MQKCTLWFFASCLLFIASQCVLAISNGEELNVPAAPAARELVKRAVILAEADKPRDAVASLRRALSISPAYLRAHIEYINIKTNFLGRYDEVQQEYEVLLQRHPRNPVYLMAVNYSSNGLVGRDALKRVVELAPAWAWAHYAQALLLKETDPENAVSSPVSRGLIWKDLRATFGTRLAEAGCDALTIAQLLGHSDVHVTMRYVRSVEDTKRAAVQAIKLSSRKSVHKLATNEIRPPVPAAVND